MEIEIGGGLASVTLNQSEQSSEKLPACLEEIDRHCEANEKVTHATVGVLPELSQIAVNVGWRIAGHESGAEPWLPGNVRLTLRKDYRRHAKIKAAPQERLVHGVLVKEV